MNYNETEYFYIYNLQGDIVKLIDSNKNVVVSYTYDAYGNIINQDEVNANALAKANPYRYKGYRYDDETGWYYLNSRYYNPEIGRFINADGILGEQGDILGHNLYAYCQNNPILFYDPSGYNNIISQIAEFLSGTSRIQAYGGVSYTGTSSKVIRNSKGGGKAGPYSNLVNDVEVAPGKNFTAVQKQKIIEENMSRNSGVVKSDLSGEVLVKPAKSMKGVTPSPNEWQIDHIYPRSAGGTNSYDNAQVLSRYENRLKWDR